MIRSALVGVLLLASTVNAQEEIVERTEPITTDVIFVVDRSCSMSGNEFDLARGVVRGMLEDWAVDELRVAVISFDTRWSRWPGEDDPSIPPGWGYDSPDTADEIDLWLGGRPPTGGTLFLGPLTDAIADPVDPLTVILVSDGEMEGEVYQHVMEQIEAAQQRREDRGQPRAVIGAVQIGNHPVGIWLEELASRGHGGLIRIMPPNEEPGGFDPDRPWVDRD